MKKSLTEIIMVLDRSGSMSGIRDKTIEGVNTFLTDQKKEKGEARFTLWQFDNRHETPFLAEDLQKVDFLAASTYVPRGSTALYDAICMAIDATGKRLAEMDEADRPENVMFVIMTDGYENSSLEFTMRDVNDKITHQTEKYGWDFTFLGANQDAMATGQTLGIAVGKSMTFAANDLGAREAFSSVSAYYSRTRGGTVSAVSNEFTSEDRSKQSDAGAKS